ncbi:MAG: elongation factor P [Alphaproteobacteria bacterium]
MKVSAITVRAGHILEHEGKLWAVIKSEIFQPGKGASVVQVEMRDARTGIKTNVRFRTQETVERVSLDEREYQFLFHEGDTYTFMDKESFEQLTVQKDVIGDQAEFLRDNMDVSIHTFEGQPLTVTLPQTCIMEIVEADAVVKGQTASSSYKPAILENGVRVMVPPFVGRGEKIVVNIAERAYVERARG